MKVTCNREKLHQAFQTVAAVVPSRSPKPILQNVKFDVSGDTAVLTATDLEIGIRYEVAEVEVETPGAAILPVSGFGSILRESRDEQLHLATTESGVAVRGDRSHFKLAGADPHEFPSFPEFTQQNYIDIPARLLREMIRRTIFATDNESSRYALGGLLVEVGEKELTIVGTDGRRLAKMVGPASPGEGFNLGDGTTIIPARAMQLIERSISDSDSEVQVAFHNNEALVQTARVTINARLLEGRFPRWQEVFPHREESVRIEMTVGPFLSAVRQAAIVTNEESRGVDFKFGGGSLVLSGQTAEVGESRIELPVAYEGADIVIKLDPRFVADFLKVLEPEQTFTIELIDAESAAICTTTDGYAYVIMPLARDR